MSLPRSVSLSALPVFVQWLLLVVLAGAAGQGLRHADIPAGQFLGPMLVAIAFGASGATIRVPKLLFKLGQGSVGALIAHSISLAVLLSLAQTWQMMLLATLLTVSLSALVGLGLVRFAGLSASTAAWGTAPGAASAIVGMAEEQGADARVVATMQYVRVVCVVVVGAMVSRLLGVEGGASEVQAAPFAFDLDSIFNLLASLAVIVGGALLGSRLPAGALLLPLFLGGLLQVTGVVQIHLPATLLAVAYGAIGCYVGLRFDRPTLRYVWGRLPAMVLGALLLIVLCAASAWVIAHWLGMDFLSVYLATSPGGLDAMAIIAVDTQSDVGLVLAMQTLRLLGVVLTGAFFARLIMRLSVPRPAVD
ncbi:MAG: AbrB family transcriptional regulator [Pseudomonas sp.]|uniref:AbrB family transcriptional regulator n=1 Tax=Pseudomonas sp. TaxID=306 RepID=UPI003D132DA8